jgi:hypothetical protein
MRVILSCETTDPSSSNVETFGCWINDWRSLYCKELKKVKQSKKIGSYADDIYAPTLSYWGLLFRAGQQESRNAFSDGGCECDADEVSTYVKR